MNYQMTKNTDGVCSDCKQMRYGAINVILREGKTSGNAEIDKLISDAQLQISGYFMDTFIDIKPIGKGGFFILLWST